MTRVFDQRFLKPNPATVAWMQQRKTCERCAHLVAVKGTKESDALRCAVTPMANQANGIRRLHYCIDARLPGWPCGPHADLFTPGVKA